MTMKEDVVSWVESVRSLNRAIEVSDRQNDVMARRIQEIVHERIAKPFGLFGNETFGFYTFLDGIRNPNWNPSVQIRPTKSQVDPSDGKCIFYVYGGNGVFFWSTSNSLRIYEHMVRKNVTLSPPYNGTELLKACEDLSKELGIPVDVLETNVQMFNREEPPRTKDDLQDMYPGGDILASGKITYHGWDCSDLWAIVEDSEKALHLHYGTSGHGFGMNHHIGPGGDYSSFFDLHQDNDTYIDNLEEAYRILKISPV